MVSKRLLQSKAIIAAALAVLVVGIGAGSAIAGRYAPSRGCSVNPSTTQPFLSWGDSHQYFLAPGGNMESDLSAFGWSLSGGAGLVAGNEPYDVSGNSADSMSLAIPAGGSATSAAVCVTALEPELRFFVANSGDPAARLKVQASFMGIEGKPHLTDLGTVTATSSWSLTDAIKFHSAVQPGPDGTGLVSFVFTPQGANGNWQIDDLYIDPLKNQ
jgi:hypothetical protein